MVDTAIQRKYISNFYAEYDYKEWRKEKTRFKCELG